MASNIVKFKKLDADAIVPKRGTPLSAGFDLYALNDAEIVGGNGTVLVRTGMAIQIPPGTYARIAMRSGLGLKEHLSVTAGVIDRDYVGDIGVLVYCTKIGHSYTIKRGERFAQLVIEKILYPHFEVVEKFESVAENEHFGFGSTGH